MDRPEGLNEYLDVTAARETHLECDFVRDSKRRDFRLAGLKDLLCLLENGAFDAAVRHRARHLSRAGHEHLRSEWPRARAPGLDHRRERDVLSLARPLVELVEDFPHREVLESSPASSRPRSSSACTLCAVRKSSQ